MVTSSQSSPRNEMSFYQEMEVTRKWTGLVVGRVEMDRTLIRYNEFGQYVPKLRKHVAQTNGNTIEF